jgi:opacity protein-like surface antigen
MRKVLGLVGATMLFAGPALAADLPVKAPRLAPLAPVSSWAGFYLGIYGGYGWGHDSIDADLFPLSNPAPKGGVFGGQIGYNWQFGTFVAGLELDSSWADLKDSQSAVVESGTVVLNDTRVPFTLSETLSAKIDYLGSFRARAGFLATPDWLFYGTAGLGWAHDSITAAETLTIGGVSETVSTSASKSHVGWAAGGGTEYKLTPNLLLRAEYLHYGFGSETYTFSGGGSVNSKLSVDVVRGGLSYKF